MRFLPVFLLSAAVCLVLLLLPQPYVSGAPPTRDVNVINTPLAVDGIVEVTNSPDVNVVNTPLPVSVVNTPSPTEAGEPIQYQLRPSVCDGCLAGGACAQPPVPEGKRLVVEYISAAIIGLSKTDSADLEVSGLYLGVFEPQGRVDNPDEPFFSVGQFISKPVKYYLDEERRVCVTVSRRTRVGNAEAGVVVVGVLYPKQ
jgi:hypothetical protein